MRVRVYFIVFGNTVHVCVMCVYNVQCFCSACVFVRLRRRLYTAMRFGCVLNNVSTRVEDVGRGNWCFARCLLFMVCLPDDDDDEDNEHTLSIVLCYVCKCVTGAIRTRAEMSRARGNSQRNLAFVLAHSVWLGEMRARVSVWELC